MKRLLTILLFLPLVSLAQTDTLVIEGEYQVGFQFGSTLKTGGGGAVGQGASYPTLATKGILRNIVFNDGKTRTILYACSGLHTMLVITAGPTGTFTGDTLWMTGFNDGHLQGSSTASAQSTFVPILLDNMGNPLTNLAGCWMSATAGTIDLTAFAYVWKTNGTVFLGGNCSGGLSGDGTTGNSAGIDSFFTQVPTPSGGWFVDNIEGMFFPIAHDTTSGGKAWTWGNQNYIGYQLGQAGDYRTPHTVSCGGKAIIGIASNSLASYCITSDHHLWGWSFYSALLGIGVHWSGYTQINSPIDLTSSQGTGLTYLEVSCIEEGTFARMSDSTLRTWGDNPEGTCGVPGDAGYELNYWATGTYVSPAVFNYSGAQGGNIVPSPLNPFSYTTPACPNTKIKHIPKGGYYQRDGWVCDYSGHWWHLGRGKNGVNLFKVNGDPAFNQEAYYPDWNNDTIVTPRNLYATAQTLAEAAYCTANPGASWCHADYTPPTEAAPTVSAGSNQSISITTAALSGSATPAGGYSIAQYEWSCATCGPSYDNAFNSGPNVSNLATGANVLTLTAWDNYNKVSTSNVTVTVSTQTNFCFATAGSGTACTSAAPCPATYFTSISWGPGDTASFNRGDTFPYEFNMSASGSAGSEIVMTAYGTGADPVISGMATLSSFTNDNNNIWQAAFSGPYPALLSHNGILQVRARTPNITSGYNVATAMTANTFTDAANASKAPIGDTVIFGPAPQIFDKRVTTGNSAGIVTVTPNFTYNNAGALRWLVWTAPDSALEYRDSSGYVQVFSVGSPSGTYQVPNNGVPLRLSGNYIRASHLHITGSDTANVIMTGAHDKLFSDTLDYGFDGVQINGAVSDTVENCYIAHMSDNGVQKIGSSNYNDVYLNTQGFDIGMFPGQGTSGGGENYWGFVVGDSGSVVKNVSLDSIGGGGIAFFGSGAVLDSISVNKYGWILEDVAAAYSWAASLPAYARQRIVEYLVASNGGGPFSHAGVTTNYGSAVCGVYLDSYAAFTLVQYCTVYNVNSNGFLNKAANNVFLYPTAYLCGFSDFTALEQGGSTITGQVLKHASFGSTTSGLPSVRFESTVAADISSFCSSCDSSQIAGALSSTQPYYTLQTGDAGTFRTPAAWTTATGYDAHSTFQTGSLLFLYNAGATSTTTSLWTKYQDLSGGVHTSVTLSGYSSGIYFVYHLGYLTKHRVGRYYYN